MKSIITKRGDQGRTDRLLGEPISKSSQVIETIGSLDELNAWIGLAGRETHNPLPVVQKALVYIMGEISAGPNHRDQYHKQFGLQIEAKDTSQLEQWVRAMEVGRQFKDWETPTSYWDVACRVCRRAERALWRLNEDETQRPDVLIYLNRLSDYLWVLGRHLSP